jgi:hypothetical protein
MVRLATYALQDGVAVSSAFEIRGLTAAAMSMLHQRGGHVPNASEAHCRRMTVFVRIVLTPSNTVACANQILNRPRAIGSRPRVSADSSARCHCAASKGRRSAMLMRTIY